MARCASYSGLNVAVGAISAALGGIVLGVGVSIVVFGSRTIHDGPNTPSASSSRKRPAAGADDRAAAEDVKVELVAAKPAADKAAARTGGRSRGARTRSVIEINSELAKLQAELAAAQQEHEALLRAEAGGEALATR